MIFLVRLVQGDTCGNSEEVRRIVVEGTFGAVRGKIRGEVRSYIREGRWIDSVIPGAGGYGTWKSNPVFDIRQAGAEGVRITAGLGYYEIMPLNVGGTLELVNWLKERKS